ncbi:protein NRT1/ PTR FAMILY 2.8-like [Herrania umbratica]|uniref:Protein NRT1/ PTR FAMILY 2.8-like n=1 Tax=Herrania umbratica TaxID=108875 RepID=A0A6J1AGU2_9ROSI|nr:protein NRT1/ PTR FAMILY 2.8-like [Herrania umbratica]
MKRLNTFVDVQHNEEDDEAEGEYDETKEESDKKDESDIDDDEDENKENEYSSAARGRGKCAKLKPNSSAECSETEAESKLCMEDSSHSSSVVEAPLSPPARRGGWRAIMFIIGNETFEKVASLSLISNISVYLKTEYNMGSVSVVNVLNIWSGFSNITGIAGAYIADAFLGKFLTLLFGSIASFLGMAMMTLTSAVPRFKPSACEGESNCPQPQGWQLAILFSGLGMLSIGAGGIRPCNISFGADQFDTSTEKGRQQLATFFNWWYFFFTVALVVALTAVVYIQTNISWVIGFAIPTACLALSTIIFLIGYNTYNYVKPQGSIFVDMVKVIAAASKKRRFTITPGWDLYNPPVAGSDPSAMELPHSEWFKFLDKASIITDPSELDNHGMAKNSWRLCSLQTVEQLKCLLAVLPVWGSAIVYSTVIEQCSTFGILQAIQMSNSIGSHFKIPPGWMNLVPMLVLAVWIFIYECIYIPLAQKITKKDKRLTIQQRLGTGFVMSILSMLASGIVEKKRRDSALNHGLFASPYSLALLLPQFVIAGLAQAFASVALLEFLTTQMPENMRTVAGALFFLALSIAGYLGSLLVTIIQNVTEKIGKTPWLGGSDLNKNKLDLYYYVIATLGVVNLLYFFFFASRYVINNSDEIGREVRLEKPAARGSRSTSQCGLEDEEKVIGIA